MTPRLPLLIALGVLSGPLAAGAVCGRFGTQLDCTLGARQVVIGTQTADDPTHAGPSLRPQSFQGTGRLVNDRPSPIPFRIELQDIGRDPSRCRQIGNERYCY